MANDKLARASSQEITGSHDASHITAALARATEIYNLVSPATSAGTLPEGCEVAISAVAISPDEKSGDVYPIPGSGKLGLSKSSLDKIAGAAGVQWDPIQSRRMDDGRDPHYCCYYAVGRYPHFDGSEQTITGTKEMDLRDGSPQTLTLFQKAEKARGTDNYADELAKARQNLLQMRSHILSHAETKARLRATRSMGLKTSYTREDLAKPFAVARLAFTGRTDDPELRREFARMRAQKMIFGSAAAYGPPALAAPVAPPPALLPAFSAPPPGMSYDRDEDDEDERPAARPARSDVPTIKFGRASGTPITEASEADLVWYAGAIEKSFDKPERERWRAQDEKTLAAVRTEIARRKAPAAAPPPMDHLAPADDRGTNPDNY